jgi:hypothetical protein
MDRVRHIFFFIAFGLSFFFVRGQQIGNYVNNGSFESLHSFSVTSWYYNVVKYWEPIDTLKYSYYTATMLPPMPNAPGSGGFQYPRTGKTYILSVFFESFPSTIIGYPRNRLKKKLDKNKVYCARYFVNLTNQSGLAMDGFGICFADSTLDTINYCNQPLTYLNAQIQNPSGNVIFDTLNWVSITGTFVATGREKYMVLGNFKSAALTTTMVADPTWSLNTGSEIGIDDVSCMELNLAAYAGPDHLILTGDSAFIGRQPDWAIDPGCIWYKLPNMTISLDTISGLWVKPSVTSTYVVRQELDCSSLKWDTVVVTINTNLVDLNKLQRLADNITLAPNPTSGNLKISFYGQTTTDFNSFSIFNSLGQIMRADQLTGTSVDISTSDLGPGLYEIHFKSQFGTVTKKFVRTSD